jgi:hypothetical protein
MQRLEEIIRSVIEDKKSISSVAKKQRLKYYIVRKLI